VDGWPVPVFERAYSPVISQFVMIVFVVAVTGAMALVAW
jgi:hypothetical protein